MDNNFLAISIHTSFSGVSLYCYLHFSLRAPRVSDIADHAFAQTKCRICSTEIRRKHGTFNPEKTSELEIIDDIAEILVFLRYLNVQHQQDTIRFNETWRKRTRDDSLPLARITH